VGQGPLPVAAPGPADRRSPLPGPINACYSPAFSTKIVPLFFQPTWSRFLENDQYSPAFFQALLLLVVFHKFFSHSWTVTQLQVPLPTLLTIKQIVHCMEPCNSKARRMENDFDKNTRTSLTKDSLDSSGSFLLFFLRFLFTQDFFFGVYFVPAALELSTPAQPARKSLKVRIKGAKQGEN
jgi:hypothetical protein